MSGNKAIGHIIRMFIATYAIAKQDKEIIT